MTRANVAGLLLSGLLAIGPVTLPHVALAQETSASAGAELRKADMQARMQELKAKIEAVKYEKMKTALALDEETAKKFFEIYKPAESDVQNIVKERNEEMKKLGLLMNGAKSDADVDPELQKIRELNKKIEDRTQRLDSDLKPILSSRQRARLLVFEHEFNKRVQLEVAKRKAAKANPQVNELRKKLRQEKIKQWLLNHPNALKGIR